MYGAQECSSRFGIIRLCRVTATKCRLAQIDVEEVKDEAEEGGAKAVTQTTDTCHNALSHTWSRSEKPIRHVLTA